MAVTEFTVYWQKTMVANMTTTTISASANNSTARPQSGPLRRCRIRPRFWWTTARAPGEGPACYPHSTSLHRLSHNESRRSVSSARQRCSAKRWRQRTKLREEYPPCGCDPGRGILHSGYELWVQQQPPRQRQVRREAEPVARSQPHWLCRR